MSLKRKENYAPLSSWEPTLKETKLNFVNLQSGNSTEDIDWFKSEFSVEIYNFEDLDQYNDLDGVAALCSALDAVVSIRTTVALIAAV